MAARGSSCKPSSKSLPQDRAADLGGGPPERAFVQNSLAVAADRLLDLVRNSSALQQHVGRNLGVPVVSSGFRRSVVHPAARVPRRSDGEGSKR